uniref:Target of Myb protein 1 n=1 Tax=Kalanchoe fedtschenkoi TaxID=63787 RepID=A0A7N1A5A8_KALFE
MAIKKRLTHKSVLTQRFSLELLEACTMNCEKVFSEVASERVLDEMVKLIENPQTDYNNRNRAMELIRAWGESEDLAYLPVFNQTYMSLMNRGVPLRVEEANSFPGQQTLESYIDQQPMAAPESYPVPTVGSQAAVQYDFAFGDLSPEEKKEVLEVTRNSLDLLSSLQSSEADSKLVKDDLTTSILGKLKESQPALQKIIQSTTEDESMLFEALNLNDQLQQIIEKYEEPQTASRLEEQVPLEAPITYAAVESKTETSATASSPKLGAPESVSDSKSLDDAKPN